MDKVIESALNFGLLGVVLVAAGWGIHRSLSWAGENVLKPLVNSFIRQHERAVDSQVKLNETMANTQGEMVAIQKQIVVLLTHREGKP